MAHVTFIHGICNKPAHDRLLRIWRESLAFDDGVDLGSEGVTSSMVYWADVMYESPEPESALHESNDSAMQKGDPDIELDWQGGLTGDEKAWADALRRRLEFDVEPPDGSEDFEPEAAAMETLSDDERLKFERIPLPWWLKRRIMKAYLRDVHHYLFNVEHTPRPDEPFRVQDEIRDRFITAVDEGAAKPGPHIVVSHSMGTVIAYDCLKRVPACPAVDGLMTIGSPLGLDEVQDKLQPGWSRDDGFPQEKVGGRWVNVFDRFDPVALDGRLANDYRRGGSETVQDINEQNHGRWRHNISKYLAGPRLREALGEMLDL